MSLARDVIRNEIAAMEKLSERLPIDFPRAVETIAACQGSLIVCGIGKAGWIGQKISASFASTGTRSHFLHPGEAFHGDLGRVGPDDVVLVLSNSGETEEVTRLLPTFDNLDIPVIAITATADNSLAKSAASVLDYGRVTEACSLGLAPSTSTTLMLALGDALVLVTSQARRFSANDFARFHPGGSLGRKLASVDEVMRPLRSCRVGNDQQTVRATLVMQRKSTRRTGAVLLVDKGGKLSGLFTDSDLARLLGSQQDDSLDQPICEVMTSDPLTIQSGSKMSAAIDLLAAHSISELPVTDRAGRPIGLIDITDVVGLS